MSKGKLTRWLAATRAVGVDRLERLEKAADSSRRLGPLRTISRRIGQHELFDRGAALTYYAVLSIVPGLLVLVSLVGLFGSEKTVDLVLSVIKDVGPSGGDTVVKGPLLALLKEDAQPGLSWASA